MLLFRSLSLRCLSTSAPALARSTKTTMVKKSVYAVAVGRRPGLYRSWEECRQQVQGWKGNMYAGFTSEHEALSYLQSHGVGLNLAAVEPPAPPAAAAAGAEPPPRKRRAPRAAGAQQASAAAVAARHAATTPPTDRCLRLVRLLARLPAAAADPSRASPSSALPGRSCLGPSAALPVQTAIPFWLWHPPCSAGV